MQESLKVTQNDAIKTKICIKQRKHLVDEQGQRIVWIGSGCHNGDHNYHITHIINFSQILCTQCHLNINITLNHKH